MNIAKELSLIPRLILLLIALLPENRGPAICESRTTVSASLQIQ